MRSFVLLGLCLVFVVSEASAVPLVTNGSFETGDFTGWTEGQPASASIVFDAPDVHSGTYAAQFASTGQPLSTLSQMLTTTAGTTYSISFWEQAGIGGGGNFNPGTQEFKALFNGITLLDQQVTTGVAYTNYTYQAMATSNSTTLEFDSRNDPSWNYLDDVVVTTVVPEPSTIALLTLGALGLLARRR